MPTPVLTAATFNVCHGGRGKGTPVDLDALVTATRALDVDILALEEVDRPSPATGRADQVAAVARAIGPSADHGESAGHAVSVFAPSTPHGDTGVALVVRGTIDRVATLPLRTRRAPRRGRRVAWPYVRADRRMCLLARVGVGGRYLSVAVAHLTLEDEASLQQLRRVVAALAARPGPRLLLGDLNHRTEGVGPVAASAGLTLVRDDTPTAPARHPRFRIDHVAVDGLVVAGSAVVDTGTSDHRALVVGLADPDPS